MTQNFSVKFVYNKSLKLGAAVITLSENDNTIIISASDRIEKRKRVMIKIFQFKPGAAFIACKL
jgi:hypothetical protein